MGVLQLQLHFMRAAHYHLTFPVHKTGQAGCGRMRAGIEMELTKEGISVKGGDFGQMRVVQTIDWHLRVATTDSSVKSRRA